MAEETLVMGTEVIVEQSGMVIRGKVIGKATMGITESYIVQCTDGQLPNDVYKYDSFIAQSMFITIE